MTAGYPSAPRPSGVTWVKARASNPSGECVELAHLPGTGLAAMRNSRDPGGVRLTFPLADMAAFIAAAKNGEFDNLLDDEGPADASLA